MSAMALAVAVPPDNGEADARPRLLLACILSAMLHLLVLGVPVNPTGGMLQAVSTIQARLEPALTSDGDSVPAQKQGNHVKSRVILRVNFLCGDTEAPVR